MPGKHGKVGWHSWGNETVATYSEKRLIKGRLIHHPKCRIWQHGDSEVRILVRQVDMVEVAPLKKPFKKKQISAWNCQKITRKTQNIAIKRQKLLEKLKILLENIKNRV